jgi:hypothetical protein
MAKKRKQKKRRKPGTGRRFQRGTEDLEQLEGIEEQQQRSRKARRKKIIESLPAELPPIINRTDKSRDRVRNRLERIKDHEDALREFGS